MRPAVGVVPDHPGRRLVEQKEGLVAVVGEGEQRERAGDRQGGAERPTDRGPRREARRPRAYGRAGHGQKRHGDVVRVPQQGPEPNVGDLPLDDDQRHPQSEQPGHGGKKVPDLGVRAAQPSGHAPKRERDEGDAHVNGAIEQPACGARQDCGLPLRGEALRRGPSTTAAAMSKRVQSPARAQAATAARGGLPDSCGLLDGLVTPRRLSLNRPLSEE